MAGSPSLAKMAALLAPAAPRDRVAPMNSVEIELWPCQYRIKRTTAGCRNLARIIVRRVAEGGAPLGQSELCNRGRSCDCRSGIGERHSGSRHAAA